jgi:hypothetical protein
MWQILPILLPRAYNFPIAILILNTAKKLSKIEANNLPLSNTTHGKGTIKRAKNQIY